MAQLCLYMATKHSRKELKALAFELFMNTDFSQKEIADKIGVSEVTISKWKSDGSWEDLKGAETITSKKITSNIYQEMYKMSLAGSALNADKLIKLAATIEKLSDRRLTVSHYINAFKDFTTYLFEKDPELAKRANLLMQEFIQEKINGK